jgi:hypothetical protein
MPTVDQPGYLEEFFPYGMVTEHVRRYRGGAVLEGGGWQHCPIDVGILQHSRRVALVVRISDWEGFPVSGSMQSEMSCQGRSLHRARRAEERASLMDHQQSGLRPLIQQTRRS